MNVTATKSRTAGRRPLRRLRHLLTLATLTLASVLVPIGTASARIEPGPVSSPITYQMPATPVTAPEAATTWSTLLVPALAVGVVVGLAAAVWALAHRRHSTSPAPLGA